MKVVAGLGSFLEVPSGGSFQTHSGVDGLEFFEVTELKSLFSCFLLPRGHSEPHWRYSSWVINNNGDCILFLLLASPASSSSAKIWLVGLSFLLLSAHGITVSIFNNPGWSSCFRGNWRATFAQSVHAHSFAFDSLWSYGLYPARLLHPWDFPGKNTGVGSHFLLQSIFLTQRSNVCLLHWQANSLSLSHLRSPYNLWNPIKYIR